MHTLPIASSPVSNEANPPNWIIFKLATGNLLIGTSLYYNYVEPNVKKYETVMLRLHDVYVMEKCKGSNTILG